MKRTRTEALKRRHVRVRQKISGTAERPRLCIHKSLKHLYAQVIDDRAGTTILDATTNSKTNKETAKSFRNVVSAKKLGQELGKKAVDKGIGSVVFDRGGYQYHGVVRAFAEAAREAGLKF